MYVLIIYGILASLAFYQILAKKEINKKFQMIILVSVVIFFMFRFNLGSDTRTYAKIFNTLPNDISSIIAAYNYRFPLFNLLNVLVRSMGGTFVTFVAIVNIVTMTCMGYIIYKESNNYFISLMVMIGCGFLEVYYVSAMRQMICMAVFFFAFYKYLKNDKYLMYYILIVPLVFIQEITLVMLIIPFFYKFRSNFLIRKSIVGIIVLAFVGTFIMTFGISIIAFIFPPRWMTILGGSSISVLSTGLRVVLFSMVIIFYKLSDKEKINEFDKFQVYMCLLSFLFFVVFIKNSQMTRVCDFIEIVQIILLPKLIMAINPFKQRIIIFFGTTILFGFLLYTDIYSQVNTWYYNKSITNYPYISIFNAEIAKQYYDFGS